MARDISKLKDKLHAVKGLDSSSAYNAEDEEEKKKKQAAQLKSQAQANAVKQALETVPQGAIVGLCMANSTSWLRIFWAI